MNEDILQEILTTLKDFKDESNKRWEENNRRWKENQKQWEENDRRWKENQKQWEENDRRWKENQKQWEENDRRWKENQKQWEENDRRWKENQKQWEENDRRWKDSQKRWEENEQRWNEDKKRWKENDSSIVSLKNEFKRFVQIVDANFEKLNNKLDNFINYFNEYDKKTELRLKKIEANQRYFEKIQNVQQDTIDIHNIKLSRIIKLLKIH